MGCDQQPAPADETVSLLEAPKEDLGTSSFEECGPLVIELMALESSLGPSCEGEETVEGSVYEQQCCSVINNPVGSEGTLVDGCVVSDQDAVSDMGCRAETDNKAAGIDGLGGLGSGPEFEKLSEVECGVNKICLNERKLKNEALVFDLKPVASSVEDLRFSGGDCLSNTLSESQMASQERSTSSAATGVEEDPYNSINLSVEGNMQSLMDLNDAVKGLHVDMPKSTSSLPNSSTECCKKMGPGDIDVPLVGINSENSKKDHYVLDDQCISGLDRVLSVGHAYALERSTTLPEQDVENLSNCVKQVDSVQCCDRELVLGSSSPSDLVPKETFKLSGGLQGNNSVAIANISCFTYERRGNAHIGEAEAVESNEALSSLRRSSRDKQSFPKASNRKYNRKGSKKALGRTMDLLTAAVRSKRSCLNRSARASGWGLVESLLKYIKLNTQVVDQGSGLVKSGGKSRKKEKVHVDASSHASSGQVSLKLKLVRKGKSTTSTPITGTDIKVNPFTGSGDGQLDLGNCIKDVAKESSMKSLEYISDIKLEKSATVLEISGVAADSVDKNLEVTLMPGKCGSMGGNLLSDKEVQKSGSSIDGRHFNSGTSPDSEVIHVPNSQFAAKELEVHHNDRMDSFTSTRTPAENGPPAMSKMRKKKGKKKEQICQLGDSDVQNRLLSSSVIDKTEMPENYGESGTKGDRLNVHPESADSWNSTKLLLPAEAKGSKKPKGLKLKEKTKLKSTPASAPRLKMDNSRKGKVDKWKLIGKYSINENGISDLAHREKDDSETAGNHGMYDSGNAISINRSGVAYEDAASLPIISCGPGQQRTQPRTAWVCCDDCLKWRCIPAHLADVIDETNCRWTCKDNQDKAFADCSIPQEKSNAEINADLNISEDEDGFDVHLSGKYYSMKHPPVPKQASWMLIKSNIFLHRGRNTQTLDEIMVCHCKSSRDGKLGCGYECLNRMLNIECVQGTCPCGDLCSNQQFQRQSYANLKWFRSGKKGYGLQVLEDITEGKFLIEYVGEVLDLTTYEARQREYASKGHKHFYFMTLNGNEVIDACVKGNLGRFINHSCDPNCRTEKWMVNGEICIGLFALRDIKKGEELTFDYNYVRVFGAAAKKCYCGSPQCRGYIGGDRLSNEVVVQSDSDEEFPEPVAVYENGEVAEDINVMSESNSLDLMEEKKEDTSLQSDANILLDGKDITNKLEESVTSIVGQLHSTAEKDNVHGSVFEMQNVDKSTLHVQQGSPNCRTSVSTTLPKRSDSLSLNVLYPERLSECVDARLHTAATEIAGCKGAQSKVRRWMKMSHPSKSGKSKESNACTSGATVDKDMVAHKNFQPTPTKLKKLVESSAKHHFETVEEKLNELLDEAGGICKRKDAFKGYLKLLVLTAASGDCNHHETIRSNKDLSMILDAILKTKSRTVLTDILNKNGLQMLHSMMKKCRGNFNMIPILRKLLKVFEFLADRKILTSEHINGDPPHPGVESFRDSILNLTEHEDRKVHQIARNFRDKWIPRPVKKFNCMEKGDWSMELKRAPNGSRFAGSHHHWCDQAERPSESTYGTKQQSLTPGHMIDSEMLEGSSGECLTNARGTGKRKSRWDQSPEEAVSPHGIKERKTADDEMQEIEEDAPPGFSCPSFGVPHPSNNSSPSLVMPISEKYPGPLKCPSKVPLGFSQERFNSGLPVAYGIPFSYVQEFGTPQASTADGWVIAPGMPFRPFPPLPLCPREGQSEAPSAFTGYLATRLPKPNNSTVNTTTTHLQHDRGGGPCNLERKPFFKQRRGNDFRKPPWGFNRNGYGSSGRNFSRRPSGVVMGTMVNDRNGHPENVTNYGVEFAGNSC